MELLEIFWRQGPLSIREVQELLPEGRRPAYTTVQTIVYRLEAKGAVRRKKKVGNAYVFEATLTQKAVHRRLANELLALFGNSVQPLIVQLIDSGRLSLDDLRAAEAAIEEGTVREKKT
jgi:BlaI family penicillinase repressor